MSEVCEVLRFFKTSGFSDGCICFFFEFLKVFDSTDSQIFKVVRVLAVLEFLQVC